MPLMRDPEPERLEEKLRVTDISRASEAHEDKLDQEDDMQMRLSTQSQDNAYSHTNSTHSLFSPSPLEKRSSTLLLCYSCQCLLFTQPQTNKAHFSPEPNWSSRATGNQCAPVPLTSAPVFHHQF